MRTTTYFRNIKNSIQVYFFMVGLSLLAISCMDEFEIDRGQPAPDSDQATVVISVRADANNVTRAATRAQDINETYIDKINVMVFQHNSGTGEYTFSFMTEGKELVSQSDLTTRFMVTLPNSSVPVKLFIVANAAEAFDGYTPDYGVSVEDVKSSLSVDYPLSGRLPMYGEVSLQKLESSSTTSLTINALRAIARVDVRKDLLPESRRFEMTEVHVFRANNRIQIIPEELVSGATRVSSPSASGNALTYSVGITKTEAVDSIGGIYIPESISYDNSEDQRLKATVVVVGGVFEGDNMSSYYRIDFNSDINAHPFGQVLRNHLYEFRIKRVSSSGWPTAEEAAENMASSLLVEVNQWEDFTNNVYFSGDYIGLSARTVMMPFLPGYTRVVDVESSFDYQIQWLDDNGKLKGDVVSEAGRGLENGSFTATIIKENPDSKISKIQFTSPDYNKSHIEYSSVLRLTINGTTADITVTKESPSSYSNRTFQVLSVGIGYGSLGPYSGMNNLSRAMRNVLVNQFTPNGPFRIGGFFFWQIGVSIYTNVDSDPDVAIFKNIIDNVDILVLGFSNIVSVKVADMLLNEWLVEKPNRVLWVFCDNGTTNANLISKTAAMGDGTWGILGLSGNSGGYRTAGDGDLFENNKNEILEFFDGPFGEVKRDMVVNAGNLIAGVCLIGDAKRTVTPLVYKNETDSKDYMLMGVNKQAGIVYCGESEFFTARNDLVIWAVTTQPMSREADTSGTINTTTTAAKNYLDVLNANLWAWMVGRVIYGPK